MLVVLGVHPAVAMLGEESLGTLLEGLGAILLGSEVRLCAALGVDGVDAVP
jgi:hypothetical protein